MVPVGVVPVGVVPVGVVPSCLCRCVYLPSRRIGTFVLAFNLYASLTKIADVQPLISHVLRRQLYNSTSVSSLEYLFIYIYLLHLLIFHTSVSSQDLFGAKKKSANPAEWEIDVFTVIITRTKEF